MTSSPRPRSVGFTSLDWGLLLAVGVMWGSSFLLIKLAVTDFAPVTVAWLRLAFGVAVLALLPMARAPLTHRQDRWLVAALGLTWMAGPFVLFSVAEQTVDSALAGMVNGATPLFTTLVAVLWFRNRPTRTVLVGLLVGFVGVLAVTIPSAGGQANLVGIGLLLSATVLYGIAFNMSEPLENRNGALPVILRAQLAALIVSTPAGALGLVDSDPTVPSWVAIVLLGAVSTGAAFACFTLLVGRVGAPRASVGVYLAPGVAVVLGALVADESVHPFALVGIGLILLGAFLTSRRSARSTSKRQPEPTPVVRE